MNYNETQQKLILREVEKDLLAIVVINMESEDFEVIYSDGAYRDYQDRFHRTDFFYHWATTGIAMVYEDDRPRMKVEISRENLSERLKERDSYYTICRFYAGGRPVYCRIKVAKNNLEEGTIVLSIRNIDDGIQHGIESLAKIRELRTTLDQMRMKNFISQMHPHFLYNALSSIREVVLTDPEYGADLLYDFTTHLRAGIRAISNDDEISFSQELDNIRAYVNIEKMRFGDRLNVVYDIGCTDFMIIPLSIQPLVENAIKHGIYEKGAAGGTVTLKSRETEDCWEISVCDDGVGFDTEEVRRETEAGRRDSTGLCNLKYRLEKMMGAKVDLKSEIGSGTTVLIHIPKKI